MAAIGGACRPKRLHCTPQQPLSPSEIPGWVVEDLCTGSWAPLIRAGNSNELACVYAALICHDDGVEISADNISAILKAASITIDPYWPSLFAKLCQGKDIGAMLSAVGSAAPASSAAPAAGGGGGGEAASETAPAAKEPEPEEEEEDMGFDLFD